MILGTKARYAVMAMVELAARGGDKPVTLAELANSQEIPLPYLEQIFARLRRAGLVASTRGPGGGYGLAQPAEQISVGEVITAVEESMKMTRCSNHARTGGCMKHGTACATHALWEGLEMHIGNYLKGVTLADVCNRALH